MDENNVTAHSNNLQSGTSPSTTNSSTSTQPSPTNNDGNKFLNKRNILVILGLVLVLEIAWAAFTLLKPQSQSPTISHSQPEESSAPVVQETSIVLESASSTVKVGDSVKVDIQMQSEVSTDGTDLIINYDPAYLTLVPTSNGSSVELGSLYTEYPVNKTEVPGKITVSGISSRDGGMVPNGLFGTINFKAKAAGKTQVEIDFQSNDTKESNVIAAGEGKDVLTEVTDLNLEILP